MNTIQTAFEGVVVDDPVLKFTKTNVAMANIRIAVNERLKDSATGEWKDGEPTYLTVMAWYRLAENAADSLQRGDRIVVVGKLKERKWEDKEGKPRTSYEVSADALGVSLKFNSAQLTRSKVEKGASRSDKADKPNDWTAPF